MLSNKKLGIQILIALLIMVLAVPAAFAGEQAQLIFNGQGYGDVSVRKGVSYISATALAKIPGVEVDQEKEIAIRSFFEGQGGKVSWDGQKKQVVISLNKNTTDTPTTPDTTTLTADEIAVKYTEGLMKANTYKMIGDSQIKFNVSGFGDVIAIPELPEMEISIEGIFQYEPMAMYMKQTAKLPFNEMELGLSPEELKEMEEMGLGGEMVTEMVWLDNAIYQKTPMFDQWIVQDLSELGFMEELNGLMQITPQQSIEMMNKAGVVNTLGDDVVIDGQKYYTIKNLMDEKGFKKMLDEILGDFDLAGMLSAMGNQADGDSEELADFDEEFQKIFELIFNNLQMKYHIDTLVNQESFLSEYMNMDLDLNIDIKSIIEEMAKTKDIDMTDIPEGPIGASIKMTGNYQLSDFGVKLELPDLSNAISQEEFMKQMMEQMEEEVEVATQVD